MCGTQRDLGTPLWTLGRAEGSSCLGTPRRCALRLLVLRPQLCPHLSSSWAQTLIIRAPQQCGPCGSALVLVSLLAGGSVVSARLCVGGSRGGSMIPSSVRSREVCLLTRRGAVLQDTLPSYTFPLCLTIGPYSLPSEDLPIGFHRSQLYSEFNRSRNSLLRNSHWH